MKRRSEMNRRIEIKVPVVKRSSRQPTAWKKRIYFTYEEVEYAVNLFYDFDEGYKLYWLDENGQYGYGDEPKWVKQFEAKKLNGESFAFWLDENSEEEKWINYTLQVF